MVKERPKPYPAETERFIILAVGVSIELQIW